LANVPELTRRQIEGGASLSLEQRVQVEVAYLTALLDAPLAIVEDRIFHRLLNAFIVFRREDRRFRFGSGGRILSAYRTPKTMIEESNRLSATIIAEYAEMLCMSLVIDAGTTEQWHFPDLMVLAPFSGLRPFSDDSLEKERLTADDYGCLIAQTIEELRQKGVKLRSIVGDDLPAQVSAFAHWSTKSHLRGQSEFLNGSSLPFGSVVSFSWSLATALPIFRRFTNLKRFFKI
jgi:hypothetical protein